jgi:ribosomal protein S18 acetylase RimI-like enzyme
MTEDTVHLRLATEADRARIVEISSQIWDGHDYVPELLDEWLADAAGEVVGAVIEDELVGFARRTWLAPGLAWFEGIRTDPAYRARGIGRAITEYLIDRARAASAIRISLSTYIDNEASIHIIKSYGFERVAMFVYRERPADAPQPDPNSVADLQIAPVSEEETVKYVSDSSFLRLANRRFPRGWRFFPFDHDPRAAVARVGLRLGWREAGKLKALLCARWHPGESDHTVFNFLDGDREAMRALLRHAVGLYAGTEIAVMVPVAAEETAAVGPLLDEFGFTSWSNGTADVYVYELPLGESSSAQRSGGCKISTDVP